MVNSKKGELITRQAAEEITSGDVPSVKIMSALTSGNLRGINRKSYGVDLATGQLVADRAPVGAIAAQSDCEPGTQLTLRTSHKGAALRVKTSRLVSLPC